MTPTSKKKTAEQAYDRALINTPQHHSCSLGTLLALQEALGVKDENVFKAASGLHGGIGRKGNICGSFLGASLMLGLMFGSSIEESGAPNENFKPEDLDFPTQLVGELFDWFGAEFGNQKCDVILRKHKKEMSATIDVKSLTKKEMIDKLHDKCNLLCAKTAAHTAETIWDILNKE
jgi:C_GCAxxG_C_C family probable redox protein